MPKNKLLKQLLATLLAALPLGALITTLGPGGFRVAGMLTATLLFWVSFFLMLRAWSWAGGGKTLAAMMILAFSLRLLIGVGMSLALPSIGYDTTVQNDGYLFNDSYYRDWQAWLLANLNTPLTSAFQGEFANDQYGGLLFLSAALYRFLSPDAHRPFLILILTAFGGAIGLPFFVKALRERWSNWIALAAGWILAVYPEAVLLGSSQMREPFTGALFCILFWAALNWRKNRWRSSIIGALSLAGIALFSTKTAVMVAVGVGVFFILDSLLDTLSRWKRVVVWLALLGGAVVFAWSSYTWVHQTAMWDSYLVTESSGWLQTIISDTLGDTWRIPFTTVYGLTQPLLPAALVAAAKAPVWSVVAVLRATGWYLLAPLLIYALFVVRKAAPGRERRSLVFMLLFSLFWVVLSSMRAGGDQWDNPRYRSMFLPFMALLAAWCLDYARRVKDPWLGRFIAAEIIFLLVFTNWYLVRYYGMGIRMGFPVVLSLALGPGILIIIGGLVWDRVRKRN